MHTGVKNIIGNSSKGEFSLSSASAQRDIHTYTQICISVRIGNFGTFLSKILQNFQINFGSFSWKLKIKQIIEQYASTIQLVSIIKGQPAIQVDFAIKLITVIHLFIRKRIHIHFWPFVVCFICFIYSTVATNTKITMNHSNNIGMQ